MSRADRSTLGGRYERVDPRRSVGPPCPMPAASERACAIVLSSSSTRYARFSSVSSATIESRIDFTSARSICARVFMSLAGAACR
jgi:hypothetical protein